VKVGLKGQAAVLTRASRGIGEGVAGTFGREGAFRAPAGRRRPEVSPWLARKIRSQVIRRISSGTTDAPAAQGLFRETKDEAQTGPGLKAFGPTPPWSHQDCRGSDKGGFCLASKDSSFVPEIKLIID